MTDPQTPGTVNARFTAEYALFVTQTALDLQELFGKLGIDRERYRQEGVTVLSGPDGSLQFTLDGYHLAGTCCGFPFGLKLDPESGITAEVSTSLLAWVDNSRLMSQLPILARFVEMLTAQATCGFLLGDYGIRRILPGLIEGFSPVYPDGFVVLSTHTHSDLAFRRIAALRRELLDQEFNRPDGTRP